MKRDPEEPFRPTPHPQDASAETSAPELLSTLSVQGETGITTSSPAPPATGDAPCGDRSGATISRYVLRRCLGQGGMGAVYAAWDPQLGREIALKLLRGDAAHRASDHSPIRLQREARAIARLSHPHVVAVHDVGTHGDEVFVAMELVDGGTLRTWLAEQTRSWSDILDVFVAAGRGLQAAHAAGLVHRDFKPENVLIGKEGRVRVADFGLARAAEEEETALPMHGSPLSEAAVDPLDMPLTHSGAIVGTPIYMAPEQFQGGAVDARTDQFSFCVALYQALYGAFPFGEGDLRAVAVRVVTGRLKPPPRKSPVPSWIAPVILRGLAAAPEERFASMEELLRALDHRSEDRRRRWGGGAAVGVILLGVVLGYGYRGGRSQHGGQAQPRRVPHYRKLTQVGDVDETAISPDGQTLAYVSGRNRLVIRQLSTNEEREAFNSGHSTYGLRWSPDSTRLLFTGRDSLGRDGIWILSGRDQQIELTPAREGSGRAVWSPDGLEIARADPQNKQIVITQWKTGAKRSIHVEGTYSW
ncbi:MAG TPA: protein kinase, partial [Polyangia bacterium]|nr:protein kinase [Polyangia bacterium]